MTTSASKIEPPPGASPLRPPERSVLAPPSERGDTIIDDEVVSVIARIAAENVPGVYQIGDSSLRSVLSRFTGNRGISSEVGRKEAAVDLEIITEYGFPIRQVCEDLRARVIAAVEEMTGRTVVEVNIYVANVNLPKTPKRQTRQLS